MTKNKIKKSEPKINKIACTKALKEQICRELEDRKPHEYKILEAPNFYFPLADKGKKFRVLDTWDLQVKDKKAIANYKDYKTLQAKYKTIHEPLFSELARIFMSAITTEGLDKKFPHCWLVPIHMYELGKDNLTVTVDILEPID